MRLAAPLALVLAALPATALAHGVRGNGEKTTARRDLPPFTAVRLEGQLDAEVKVGPAQSVAVTIDSNLQEHVQTRVEDGTLVVRMKGNVSWDGEGRIELSMPALRAFRIEGSGAARIDGGQGDLELVLEGSGDLRWAGKAAKLKVRIEGSSDARLEGTAEALAVSIDGSGDVDAAGLTAKDASVNVAGTGDVELTVGGGAFTAAVSGTGEIAWHGSASATSTSVSGTGTIVHR
jgi:hypothetical protein